MIAKRVIGVLILIAMVYFAYIKIGENLGNSDYAGFLIFFLVVALFLVFLAIRKILTY